MKNAKALVKFDFDVAIISALDERYKGIQTAEGTKNFALVMKGLSEYREIRLAIDDQHKKLKTDILLAGRSLDGDKTRLKTLIQPGENRLRDLKNAEDDRKDAIREEKEAKEKERIQEIQEKVNSIRTLAEVHNVSASAIQDRLTLTTGIEISKEVYQEFTDQALGCQKLAVSTLEDALNDRLQFEKEEAERKAEAERLEAQRKEQEAAQAKIDEENRKLEEEKAKLEADKKAEEERKDQEDFEQAAIERAEAYAAQKAKNEAIEKEEKEREEAEEKERKAARAPDKERLIIWINNFNERTLPSPVGLKSKKAQTILRVTKGQIEKILQDALHETNKL